MNHIYEIHVFEMEACLKLFELRKHFILEMEISIELVKNSR